MLSSSAVAKNFYWVQCPGNRDWRLKSSYLKHLVAGFKSSCSIATRLPSKTDPSAQNNEEWKVCICPPLPLILCTIQPDCSSENKLSCSNHHLPAVTSVLAGHYPQIWGLKPYGGVYFSDKRTLGIKPAVEDMQSEGL